MNVTSDTSTRTKPTVLTGLFWRFVGLIVSTVIALALQKISETGFGRQAHRSQVDALVSRPTGLTLDDVGGHETAKQELRTSVLFPLLRPDVFYDATTPSLRPPRGILLHGPPGTGKTMLARAVACEAGVPLLTLHNAALENKWWGETPKLLASIFREAVRVHAPCIIFIDEIDSMGRARSDQDQSCVYTFKCELFRNLDNIVGHPIIVIACTNCPHSLDPALRRRFQRQIEIPPPSLADRRGILARLLRHEESAPDLGEKIAARSPGFTGADLTSLYEAASAVRMDRVVRAEWLTNASPDAILRDMGPLTMAHIEEGARRISKTFAEAPLPKKGDDPKPT